jgi:tricorn protease
MKPQHFFFGIILLFVSLLSSASQPDAPNVKPFLRSPDIHGDKVVFTCEGDLWLGDLRSGKASRLTRDEGVETDARFSPDGNWIAYTASYEGVQEVYLIPTTGGVPKRLTYRHTFAQTMDWTPDGKRVVFRSSDVPQSTMFSVPMAGGYPQRFPLEFASHLSYAPDGHRYVLTRFARSGAAWFRYEGGLKNDLYLCDESKKEFRRIFETKTTNEYPVWAGSRICFVHDEGDGTFSVVSVTPDGRSVKRVAGPYDVEIRNLQTDGKRLIYEKGVELEVCDLETGKVATVSFDLASDLMHAMPYLTPAEKHVSFAHLGPTGKRVLVETRGHILSVPAKEGDVRIVLGKEGVRYRLAAMSPDAQQMAYISDETREQQLYVANADGSHPRPLTSDAGRQLKSVRWSPDSRWIALTDSETRLRLIEVATGKDIEIARGTGRDGPRAEFSPDSRWLTYVETDRVTYFGSLVIYEIATGKRTVLGDGMANDFAPTFSSDGKWLAFLSNRHIVTRWDHFLDEQITEADPTKAYLLALKKDTRSPFLPDNDEESPPSAAAEKKDEPKANVVEIDFDGLYDRLIEIPVPPAQYSQIAVVGDRVLLLASGNLTFYDLKAKKSGKVAEGVSWFQVSADAKKLLLYSGANSRVVDVTAQDVPANSGKLDFAAFQLRIHPKAEWEQMYWDAWRLIRDYFYVANLHGADWQALGNKYAKWLPSVRSRDELNQLIRWLLAELTISHAGVFGGDTRSQPRTAQPAFLGVDVEPDASGYYKITKIIRGDGFHPAERSPLAAPGLNVKEGDFLIEVAGVPAREGSDFLQGLVGRAGQVVAVKVNDKPTPDGARTVRVKPVSSERRMRYLQWVKEKRDYVAKSSGGRIGYLHLAAMGDADMADFIKQYLPQRNKDALVIDVRFNGGGYISAAVNTVLKSKVHAFFNTRANPQPWTRQGDYFAGPMACLINEFNYSDGELFPHEFRSLGLGPLIGRRTASGEVGSDPGWPLADGGVVRVPNYGAWTPQDGWIIENKGVSPDYDVESDPNAYAQGKDPQLDKAIEVLLESLKKNPVKRPMQPPDPVRVKNKGK